MAKNASPKRRMFIAKNLIMMLVLAVTITLAVFSWFTSGTSATADGISVATKYGSGIDIAPCIKTYNIPNTENYDSTKGDYSLLTDGPGEFRGELEFKGPYKLTKDCTGDGVDLIVPDFNVTKDYELVRKGYGKEVNTNHAANPAVSDQDAALEFKKHPDKDFPEYQYIQIEFYVRSKTKDLVLSDISQMLSLTENNGGSLSAVPSNDKKSAYGAFNVDGLVGAMRVALICEGCTSVNQQWETVTDEKDGTTYNRVIDYGTNAPTTQRGNPEKQILWVPRPDIQLVVNPEAGNISDWLLITNVGSGVTYTNSYYKGTASDVKLVEDQDPKTVVSSGTNGGIKCLGRAVNMLDLSYFDSLPQIDLKKDKNDITTSVQYYVNKITMKIWIEGTDTEARRAMDGGEFSLRLCFQ